MTTTTSHIPRTTEEAFTIAKTAATRLRTLGATRIVLFGSLARGTYVPEESDIDIYFEGIPLLENDMATVTLLDEFGENVIDPIPSPYCPDYLRTQINNHGREL